MEANGDERDFSWTHTGGKGSHWCEDVEEGPDREHSLGWQDEGSQAHLSWSPYESELGSTEEMDQVRRLETTEGWICSDGEPELGWTGHGRGCQPCEPMDDREGDDEREAIDERELDHGEHDGIGTIMGGQGL